METTQMRRSLCAVLCVNTCVCVSCELKGVLRAEVPGLLYSEVTYNRSAVTLSREHTEEEILFNSGMPSQPD